MYGLQDGKGEGVGGLEALPDTVRVIVKGEAEPVVLIEGDRETVKGEEETEVLLDGVRDAVKTAPLGVELPLALLLAVADLDGEALPLGDVQAAVPQLMRLRYICQSVALSSSTYSEESGPAAASGTLRRPEMRPA